MSLRISPLRVSLPSSHSGLSDPKTNRGYALTVFPTRLASGRSRAECWISGERGQRASVGGELG
jgi:hypothetical protein